MFPGNGDPIKVAKAKFQKSLDEVNIGAFPLRPNDVENRKLLEHFIEELINMKSATTISKVIPQKGAYMEVADRVLVGNVKPSNRKGYYEDFENGCARLYYTGAKFPSTIALHNLHFFVPYFKEKGIRDVYEIEKIRTIKGSEAKQLEGIDEQKDDIRLAFELKFSRRLSTDFQMIKTEGMIAYSFIDTTFDKLERLTIKYKEE